MDHYEYGTVSLGKRKSSTVNERSPKKAATKPLVRLGKILSESEEQKREIQRQLEESLVQLDELEKKLEEQLKEKKRQQRELEEQNLLSQFVVACEMAKIAPDANAAREFSSARRKFLTGKRRE
nr:putative aerobic respiration control sensor protein [Marseillevirus futianmevirus]